MRLSVVENHLQKELPPLSGIRAPSVHSTSDRLGRGPGPHLLVRVLLQEEGPHLNLECGPSTLLDLQQQIRVCLTKEWVGRTQLWLRKVRAPKSTVVGNAHPE